MWEYTDKVKELFLKPKNVGEIPDADAVATVGSLACGDALTLYLKLDEKKEKIVDAKFKTFGCASAIASSSALTELIKGMTLEQAQHVTNRDIAEYLGGLPEQKMHCSVMGKEALEAAIENYYKGLKGEAIQQNEKLICTCFQVYENVIIKAIQHNNLKTVEQVTHYTKAGGGCGRCREDITKILHAISLERHSQTSSLNINKPKLTNLQKIKLIEDVIEKEIRPALKLDGGDIELVDIEGNKVYVSLKGTCAGCKISRVTVDELITKKLHKMVSGDIEVIAENIVACSQ